MSTKAILFALVGVANTLVEISTFWIALSAIGLPLIPANVISWFLAVSGSYIMNSRITFAAETGGKLLFRGYLAFIALGIAGLLANTATLIAATKFTHVLVAKLVATGVSFAVNFTFSNYIIFRFLVPSPGRERRTAHH